MHRSVAAQLRRTSAADDIGIIEFRWSRLPQRRCKSLTTGTVADIAKELGLHFRENYAKLVMFVNGNTNSSVKFMNRNTKSENEFVNGNTNGEVWQWMMN